MQNGETNQGGGEGARFHLASEESLSPIKKGRVGGYDDEFADADWLTEPSGVFKRDEVASRKVIPGHSRRGAVDRRDEMDAAETLRGIFDGVLHKIESLFHLGR